MSTRVLCGILGTPEKEKDPDLARTLVIMMHDIPGNKNGENDRFRDIALTLNKGGYHTLRFDFAGFGESDGEDESFRLTLGYENIQDIIFWAKGKKYNRFIWIAEGVAAGMALTNMTDDVGAMVLISPVFDMKEHARAMLDMHELTDKIERNGFILHKHHHIHLDFLVEMRRTDLLPAMRQAHIPVLILHGGRDDFVPASTIDIAREHLAAKRLEITVFHDGDTTLSAPNHHKAIIDQASAYVREYALKEI